MNFKNNKTLVRAQIAAELTIQIDDKSIIIDSLTEKIMALQFNQNFYRGEGRTTDRDITSSIKLEFKTRTLAFARGIGISAYTIFQVLKSRKSVKTLESLGWVYSIPKQYIATREDIQDLENFLDSTLKKLGQVPPARYIVQSGTFRKQARFGRVDVVPYTGSKIITLENIDKLKTIGDLLKRTFVWVKASITHPILLLIGPEYIIDKPAVEFRKMRESDVLVTTQSQLLAPPWVFKSFKRAGRVMYWYSNNSSQISKQNYVNLDYTYLTQDQISNHFVWSSSWGKLLKEYNQNSEVTPIGPIIFKDLSGYTKSDGRFTRNKKTILIFDVTPKINAGNESFYSEEKMRYFILDLVQTIKKKYPQVVIKLKPKREYSSGDSLAYQNFLKSQNSNIHVLRWDTSIVNEILKSDLVICIPFSSPALISKFLGVPTFFYTPSREFNLEEKHEGISVIEGIEELQLFLDKLEN